MVPIGSFLRWLSSTAGYVPGNEAQLSSSDLLTTSGSSLVVATRFPDSVIERPSISALLRLAPCKAGASFIGPTLSASGLRLLLPWLPRRIEATGLCFPLPAIYLDLREQPQRSCLILHLMGFT
jgi:hypothetical protein